MILSIALKKSEQLHIFWPVNIDGYIFIRS